MEPKIVCYACEGKEINRLDRCPFCGTTGEIGFEESREWHWLARLWAGGKGYWGERDTLSLPSWVIQKEPPERLEEWKSFKARLLDVNALPLPARFVRDYWGAFGFWIDSSGILPLQQGTAGDLLSLPLIGSLVRQLATAYADHYKAQWEAEEKAEAERVREEERLKNKEKPHLLKRLKGGGRSKHERV